MSGALDDRLYNGCHFFLRLTQAEGRKSQQHDHDEPYQVDDAIHRMLLSRGTGMLPIPAARVRLSDRSFDQRINRRSSSSGRPHLWHLARRWPSMLPGCVFRRSLSHPDDGEWRRIRGGDSLSQVPARGRAGTFLYGLIVSVCSSIASFVSLPVGHRYGAEGIGHPGIALVDVGIICHARLARPRREVVEIHRHMPLEGVFPCRPGADGRVDAFAIPPEHEARQLAVFFTLHAAVAEGSHRLGEQLLRRGIVHVDVVGVGNRNLMFPSALVFPGRWRTSYGCSLHRTTSSGP